MEDRRQATTRPSAHPSSIMLLFWSIICMLALQSRVNAFHPQVAPVFAKRPAITKLQLAREYIVIGGNLPGTNPDGDNTNNNMSKKERRRLEREKGEADFKSGKYKSKKKKKIIDYDKLEDKVTRERTLMPREQRELANKLNAKTNGKGNRLTEKAARLQRQRTAGGTINSTGETVLPQSPEEQAVLIRVAKRGNKVVTMVQGMCLFGIS